MMGSMITINDGEYSILLKTIQPNVGLQVVKKLSTIEQKGWISDWF